MKTNTIYIFIIALISLILMSVGVLYMHLKIEDKVEIVKEFYLKEKQNSNLEFGKNLENKIELISEQENKIKSNFLTNETLISFVEDMENLSRANSVEMMVEKVDQAKAIKIDDSLSINPAYFNINLKGSYKGIKKIMEDIHNLPTLILVEEFKLYDASSEEEGELYTARIVLKGNVLQYAKN